MLLTTSRQRTRRRRPLAASAGHDRVSKRYPTSRRLPHPRRHPVAGQYRGRATKKGGVR
jgi:hypothetical protein